MPHGLLRRTSQYSIFDRHYGIGNRIYSVTYPACNTVHGTNRVSVVLQHPHSLIVQQTSHLSIHPQALPWVRHRSLKLNISLTLLHGELLSPIAELNGGQVVKD